MKRIISAFVIILVVLFVFTSCNDTESLNEEVKVVQTVTTNINVNSSVNNKNYEKMHADIYINSSDAEKGIVKVKYLKDKMEGIRIYLLYNYESCAGYEIKDTSKDTVISLTNGIGEYYIEVVKNDGVTETILASQTIKVENIDEFTPFLESTYAVKWDNNMNVIKDAKKLTEQSNSISEKINIIKHFVIDSLEYSEDKQKDYTKWSYFPNANDIYKEGSGVCVDFATMFAAICRSQNIPCKVVTGYAGTMEEFHVWTEVYNEDEATWNTIDLTLEDAKSIYSDLFISIPDYYIIVTED